MARNEEKQLGRLNRLHLKKLHEDIEKKNPKRPSLVSLTSADEVKQWIPNIKKDIDFCLKLQVPCYPERKIAEINVRIDKLQGEYKAFLRKLRELDPTDNTTPFEERAYQNRKRSHSNATTVDQDTVKKAKDESKSDITAEDFVKIATPILDCDFSSMYGHQNSTNQSLVVVDHVLQNKPLSFNSQGQFTGQETGTEKSESAVSDPGVDLKARPSLCIPYSDSESENSDT